MITFNKLKRRKYYSLLRLLYECLKVLRRAINWLFLRHDRLPHEKLAPLEQLQDRLGYVYLCVQTKNACISRWRRYVFAPPRGDRRDEACVYLKIRFDGKEHYVGQSTDWARRNSEHNTHTKAVMRSSRRLEGKESYLYWRLSRIGPGSFIRLPLRLFGPASSWSSAPTLLRASLLHVERYFISTYSRRSPSTLNTVGTWRAAQQTAQATHQIRSLIVAPGRPRAHLRDRYRFVRSASAILALRQSGRRNLLFRCYIYDGMVVHDLYLLLAELARNSVTLPVDVTVRPGGLDLSRYSDMRMRFGQSEIELQGSRAAVRPRGGDRMLVHALTARHLDSATSMRIRSVNQKPRFSDATRHALAQLSWNYSVQSAFYKNCTIYDCHYCWLCAKRYGQRKRADRIRQVLKTCRAKFGVNAGLNNFVRVPTPYFVDRHTVTHMVQRWFRKHTPLDPRTTAVVCERLRTVFTRTETVGTLFDTVRRHMSGYVHGTVRACTCKDLPDVWRDADG